MLKKKDLIQTVEYWMETIQNELFRQLSDYMEREKMNKTEFAKKLNVSKSYVSQVLNGAFNFTLKKLIQLSLAIGRVPYLTFITPEEYLKKEAQKKNVNPNQIEEVYLRELYLGIQNTLSSLEELKQYDSRVYDYFKDAYVGRLKLMFKSVDVENTRVENFLREVKTPEIFLFTIDKKPVDTLTVLTLIERQKDVLDFTDLETRSSLVSLAESLKNNGVDIEYELDLEKLGIAKN